jgi:hypothetical protein
MRLNSVGPDYQTLSFHHCSDIFFFVNGFVYDLLLCFFIPLLYACSVSFINLTCPGAERSHVL